MPPCARATVGQAWERSWPSSTKRCSVGLPSPDRELPSRGFLHSSRTLGSGLPISTLFSLVLYVAGIVRGKMSGPLIRLLGLLKPIRFSVVETGRGGVDYENVNGVTLIPY